MNDVSEQSVTPSGAGFKAVETAAVLSVGLLMAYALWLVFMVVPNERVMGPVQRIFYFHVGSAIACYCSVATVLFGSLAFLATRRSVFDIVSEAGAEVGLVLSTAVMMSGMIWARPIWNTWFHWEPRLLSFLCLWLIFLALTLLRKFGDPERTPAHCAVLGIVATITVPIVVYSIQLLPQVAQLHPQVVGNRGLREETFRYAWGVTTCALIAFQFLLVYVRVRIGWVHAKARQAS